LSTSRTTRINARSFGSRAGRRKHLARVALDRAAVLLEPGEHPTDHSGRVANHLHLLDPVEHVLGHRAVALAHHDQVRLAPGAVDHLVERGSDRPHEKKHAEDHAHAEHDAEAGQDRPQRPRPQLSRRKITRSAAAAAAGSWVTMTIV